MQICKSAIILLAKRYTSVNFCEKIFFSRRYNHFEKIPNLRGASAITNEFLNLLTPDRASSNRISYTTLELNSFLQSLLFLKEKNCFSTILAAPSATYLDFYLSLTVRECAPRWGIWKYLWEWCNDKLSNFCILCVRRRSLRAGFLQIESLAYKKVFEAKRQRTIFVQCTRPTNTVTVLRALWRHSQKRWVPTKWSVTRRYVKDICYSSLLEWYLV